MSTPHDEDEFWRRHQEWLQSRQGTSARDVLDRNPRQRATRVIDPEPLIGVPINGLPPAAQEGEGISSKLAEWKERLVGKNPVSNAVNQMVNNLPVELHVITPKYGKWSACGPGSKTGERIRKYKETGDTKYIYKNDLDKACFQHDLAYGEHKDVAGRILPDKQLKEAADRISKDMSEPAEIRHVASLVSKVFERKIASDSKQLAPIPAPEQTDTTRGEGIHFTNSLAKPSEELLNFLENLSLKGEKFLNSKLGRKFLSTYKSVLENDKDFVDAMKKAIHKQKLGKGIHRLMQKMDK
ncbi:TPA_asm: PLA2X [Capsaspora MELD virus 1]|nr:TPA_asm: PLA2X [Capsaspora MELD virus 1]